MTSTVVHPFCPCRQRGPRFPEAALVRQLGEAPGSSTEIKVLRCLACQQDWIMLLNEDMPGKGRWYATPLAPEAVDGIAEATAMAEVRRQPWHIRGGRHFGHDGRRCDFPLREF